VERNKSELSQSFQPEVVDEMLENRKKSLEEVARTKELSRELNSPDKKKYGYLSKEQVDEIVKTGKMPITYEARKQKLLAAIEQDKITWEDTDYIREDLMADNDIRFALDHQYNKQANNVETVNMEYSSKTQELLNESQKILSQPDIVTEYEEVKQPELSPDYSVDQNLEGYTKLEQEINNNPNLSEEQKQAMRNSLWTDFDNYVQQNPEQHKQK